jgi:hypothetical protein
MATRQLPVVGGHETGFGATMRNDAWWAGPLITFTMLSLFVVYTTWAALQGNHYYADPYLSPFYSPLLFIQAGVEGGAPLGHAWIGDWPGWLPAIVPVSPAIFILVFPGAFRFTCYYYRKAYYRSFAGSPPGCAVGPLASRPYKGETGLLIFQNLHRFALYFALLFLVFLWHDFIKSLTLDGKMHFGVGSLVIFANCTFLSLYTISCHSFRHLVGGNVNSYSEAPLGMLRHKLWGIISKLNVSHMSFAWVSLFGVALCDFYIRSVASGAITDIRFL